MAPPIKTFHFIPSLQLRAIEIDGEPWFMAADACAILGHQNVTRDISRHVDDADKRTVSVGLRGRAPVLVNETGIYSLIMGSKKPEARGFNRWVTKDVLPAIGRNGGYMTPRSPRPPLTPRPGHPIGRLGLSAPTSSFRPPHPLGVPLWRVPSLWRQQR